MIPQIVFWSAVAGAALLLIWPLVSKGVARLLPSASTSKAVAVLDTASKYAQYATAHGALYTLRVIDFENSQLDISAELTAIDSKLAIAMKAQNATETPAAK